MIDMVIPTGAMGNLTGGYMAKEMGVPIGRLCAGVNINGENGILPHHLAEGWILMSTVKLIHYVCSYDIDITHRVIERGEFHRKPIQKTLSDAINIEVVSR